MTASSVYACLCFDPGNTTSTGLIVDIAKFAEFLVNQKTCCKYCIFIYLASNIEYAYLFLIYIVSKINTFIHDKFVSYDKLCLPR